MGVESEELTEKMIWRVRWDEFTVKHLMYYEILTK